MGKDADADTYYNLATLLLEDNGITKVDVPTSYKYANIIASKSHTFGTYMFAALNDYNLGSTIQTCEIANEFYKAVSERNVVSRNKNNAANYAYKQGFYRTAALIYSELAEEGIVFSDINTGVLFYYYNIFNNQTFNDYNAFKYFKRQAKERQPLPTLYMADMYYTG